MKAFLKRNRRFVIIALLLTGALTAGAMLIMPARTIEAGEFSNIFLPGGYRIEPVATGLTCPTSITWDPQGNMYVTLAGNPYPTAGPEPGKVVRISRGVVEVFVDGLNAPATDAKFLGEGLYVAHRGALSVFRNGERLDLISGLPAGDHFTCEIAFGPDGWIYVGNGSVTNSGVVGEDNFRIGWAQQHPQQCDVPAREVVLTGENYPSPDFRTSPPSGTVTTGGFVPFGTQTSPGQKIPGNVLASGAILRVRSDGTGLEVYAWGLRNPFGMRFDGQGRLVAVDQGFDDRGSRPIANAPDAAYVITRDSWYGWPDFAAGVPVSDPRLRSPGKASPTGLLLKDHPPVEKPIATFGPDTGAMKFDFAPSGFDKKQRMFLAAFGPVEVLPAPSAGGASWTKQLAALLGRPSATGGGKVLTVDLATGKVETFAYTKDTTRTRSGELRINHPIDAKFGPDGCLYVVDFGALQVSGGVRTAVPGSGVVWKISRQRSEYTEFVTETLRILDEARNKPWDPDYGPLEAQLREFFAAQPEEWGLYFKDLVSGDTFGINENVEIPAASTVKVPVVLYASELVHESKLSWNERLTYYSERDWRSGAGTLQFTAKNGDTFSIRELAEKAIRDSDNVAWKMLERRLGKQNIINFMKSIGGTVVYPGGQNISTPRDNAIYMEAALNFARESPEGQKLIFDLAHTVWNTGLNRYITEVPVAHKEGDITGVADDVGIVFSDFPYILSIMSRGHQDVEAGFAKIGEISRTVYDYQQSLIRR